MAERTTRRQVEAMGGQVMRAAREAGIDVKGWTIDYAPSYGGWNLQRPVGEHGGVTVIGGAMLDGNRLPSGDFVRALRIVRDMLELAAK